MPCMTTTHCAGLTIATTLVAPELLAIAELPEETTALVMVGWDLTRQVLAGALGGTVVSSVGMIAAHVEEEPQANNRFWVSVGMSFVMSAVCSVCLAPVGFELAAEHLGRPTPAVGLGVGFVFGLSSPLAIKAIPPVFVTLCRRLFGLSPTGNQ